jgi:hypothetical protein
MTGFTAEQNGLLAQPLKRGYVQERSQANRTFSYLEAWHVIAEANRIFGFDGWNREMADCRCVAERETKIGPATDRQGNPQQQRDGWRVGYVARVRVTVGNVVREGCGYGSGIDQDLGSAHESALKEAESDAMKRALMTFGNQFGLALYDKAQSNVEAPTRPAAAPHERLPRLPAHPPTSAAAAAPNATSAAPSHSRSPSSTGNGKHSRWDHADARFRAIEKALKTAQAPKLITEIWSVNQADLDLIEELHKPSYDKLEALRDQMLAQLESSAGDGVGSSPALMGEP